MSEHLPFTPAGQLIRNNTPSTSLRAVAYLRATDLITISIQNRSVREYAAQRGIIIDSIVKESNREAALPPASREAWTTIATRPPQHLILNSLSTLSAKPAAARDQILALLERNSTIHLTDEAGCALRSDSDTGRHLILSALNLADTLFNPSKQQQTHKTPIGFMVNRRGQHVPNPIEMNFLHQLRELHGPDATWTETALTLNPSGSNRFRNRKITPQLLKQLLAQFNEILAAANHNHTISSSIEHHAIGKDNKTS